MPLNVLHFRHEGRPQWGVVRDGGVTPVPGDFATTRAFLEANSLEALARLQRADDQGSRRRASVARHAEPAVPLPGRELPPAHDRVRHGPGRQDLQHDLHQGAELHRAREHGRRAAVARALPRLRDRARPRAEARRDRARDGDRRQPARVRRRRGDRQRLFGARRADPCRCSSTRARAFAPSARSAPTSACSRPPISRGSAICS